MGEAEGVEGGQRKQIRCPLTPRRQLHETWEFDLPRLIRTAASVLVLCWRSDWIPKGIIKGSFLQEVPHITLPPLNHICSAISSSSTCSNFALEGKKNLSLLFFCLFCSFLLLHFPPELTSLFTLTSSPLIIFRLKLGLLLRFSVKVSRHLNPAAEDADTSHLLKNTNTGNKRGHFSSRDHRKLNKSSQLLGLMVKDVHWKSVI